MTAKINIMIVMAEQIATVRVGSKCPPIERTITRIPLETTTIAIKVEKVNNRHKPSPQIPLIPIIPKVIAMIPAMIPRITYGGIFP